MTDLIRCYYKEPTVNVHGFSSYDSLKKYFVFQYNEGADPHDQINWVQLVEINEWTAEDLKTLESCFGKIPGSHLHSVWYLLDCGDHIDLAEWGLQNRLGVQVSEKVLGVQAYNEMMDVRCDWRYVFVRRDALDVGWEAVRQFVLAK